MDLDLERCSVSSSGSSSAADRMELEAAEALADLAHLAMRESSGSEWGSKGKRARKRVRAESDLVSTYSDLPRVRFLNLFLFFCSPTLTNYIVEYFSVCIFFKVNFTSAQLHINKSGV